MALAFQRQLLPGCWRRGGRLPAAEARAADPSNKMGGGGGALVGRRASEDSRLALDRDVEQREQKQKLRSAKVSAKTEEGAVEEGKSSLLHMQ